MFRFLELDRIALLAVALVGLGATPESRASGSSVSCQRADYSIELGAPLTDQWLGFELWTVIGVQFEPPAGMQIVALDYESSSAMTTEPIIGEDYVIFMRPLANEAVDVTVHVRYWDVDDPDPPAALPTVPVVFKPRRDCPS